MVIMHAHPIAGMYFIHTCHPNSTFDYNAKCTLLAISNSLICIFFSCGQTAHTIEGLVKLEAKYGPLIGFSPAVYDVLDYLQSVRAYLTL